MGNSLFHLFLYIFLWLFSRIFTSYVQLLEGTGYERIRSSKFSPGHGIVCRTNRSPTSRTAGRGPHQMFFFFQSPWVGGRKGVHQASEVLGIDLGHRNICVWSLKWFSIYELLDCNWCSRTITFHTYPILTEIDSDSEKRHAQMGKDMVCEIAWDELPH